MSLLLAQLFDILKIINLYEGDEYMTNKLKKKLLSIIITLNIFFFSQLVCLPPALYNTENKITTDYFVQTETYPVSPTSDSPDKSNT